MIWILIAIAGWAVVHSWLAALSTKDAIRTAMPGLFRFYRLAYNVFSAVSLLPILLLVKLLPSQMLYAVGAPWLYAMLAGQIVAAILLALALLQTDVMAFIGLRQALGGERIAGLSTGGFYRWVRHPLYLFGLIILWLSPVMTTNMLTAYLAFTIYLYVGALFEERKLRREFGEAYDAYRRRTPMILPIHLPGRNRS